MAACGSLQHIFDNKPLSENPSLLESLSPWNQIKPVKPIEQSSFTEMFGELHFKESSHSPSSSSSFTASFFSSLPSSSSSSSSSFSSFIDLNSRQIEVTKFNQDDSFNKKEESWKNLPLSGSFSSTTKNQFTESFSLMNYESLQLCTEGLGFESSGDVGALRNDVNKDWQYREQKGSMVKNSVTENQNGEFRRSRSSGGAFPPPISCIGNTGKPQVCFKSYRHGGRFVLKEIRIPTRECLQAYREDGRLKLHFVQPDEENFDEEETGEETYTEDDDQEENDSDNGGGDG